MSAAKEIGADVKTVKRKGVTIKVRLTEQERTERAERASKLLSELDEKRRELKKLSADLREDIKDIQGQINMASKAHTSGEELQTVDCSEVFDLAKREIYFVYRGQSYNVRPMAQHEFDEKAQRPLFNEDEGEVVDADYTVEEEVQDIVKAETKGRGRGKKDHTAKAKAEEDKA